MLKFIYSEKATKFCEISTVDLSYVVPVKSTVEILQKFVAFSEYMNFTTIKSAYCKMSEKHIKILKFVDCGQIRSIVKKCNHQAQIFEIGVFYLFF